MLLSALLALSLQAQLAERASYQVDHLSPPADARLEVGGLAFLPDGRLAVSTRRGQVWLLTDPLAEDPGAARFELFADGLQEGLGLGLDGDQLLIVQRGELSRLLDLDGDGSCDEVQTLCDDWGLSGNYHEFAFGLPRGPKGERYVGLNLGFFDPDWWHGRSAAPWRGWILSISPDGRATPFASGFRSPNGLGLDAQGRLLVTDNQGDWLAACPVHHVRAGGFYGHPASLAWHPDWRDQGRIPSETLPVEAEREPAAIWIPYEWSQSTGNLVHDDTRGQFGPFQGQLFIAELTLGSILRAELEEVEGVTQGWVTPFLTGVGSVNRVLFAPDGTLLCGLTNRGWGGRSPADGLARVRWTGRSPFAVRSLEARSDGFHLSFTGALDGDAALDPADIRVAHHRYDWWWEYGSPERQHAELECAQVEIAPDRRSLRLRVEGLEPGRVVRLLLPELLSESGEPLQGREFAYTLNRIPGDPRQAHVARAAIPPPSREERMQGWLRLTWDDALDSWEDPAGWLLCDAELDREDPARIETSEGFGALVNDSRAEAGPLVSRFALADHEARVEFFLPQGGQAEVLVHGRYGVLLSDTDPGSSPTLAACGALLPGPGFEGAAPARNVYRGAGRWHELYLRFRAPRLDPMGLEVEPARLEEVRLDELLLHEDVLLTGPSAQPLLESDARGPLCIRPRDTPIALRGFEVRALDPQAHLREDGWVSIFDGEGLEGWQITDGGDWSIEEGRLIARGERSHIFSPRGDYTDHEVLIEARINVGGNSGLYARAALGPGWPSGYEAQINSSHPDPQKTGSLYGLAPVKASLVPVNTWFEERLLVRDQQDGVYLRAMLNGVVVSEHLDLERRRSSGHIALQQHHLGSELQVRRVLVRELD